MKWTNITGLILALLTLTWLGVQLMAPRDLAPREHLQEVQARRDNPLFDERLALRELEQIADEAILTGVTDVAVDALITRSEVLAELGAWVGAREALERILLEFAPGRHDLTLRLIDMHLRDNQVDEAALEVARLVTLEPNIVMLAPNLGAAWAALGRVEFTRANNEISLAEAATSRSLSYSKAREAMRIVDLLAALDTGDARRSSLLAELDAIFGLRQDIAAQKVKNLAERAGQHSSRARKALALSLSLDLDGDALSNLMELYVRAGHNQEAIDLGNAAQSIPELEANYRITHILLRALRSEGRIEPVRNLLSKARWKDWRGDETFYRDSVIALFELGEWALSELREPTGMSHAIEGLKSTGGRQGKALGFFLEGMATYASGNNDVRAANSLRNYLGAEIKIYPDGEAMAWFAIAEIERVSGSLADSESVGTYLSKEREALVGALTLEPDADGEAWLRLATIQLELRNSGYRVPEERWTKGMSLLPERTAELKDQWAHLGTLAMSENEDDLATVLDRMLQDNKTFPAGNIGPYLLYLVAQYHLEAGDRPRAAIQVCERMLKTYPGLLPVIDLSIEAHLELGIYGGAGPMILRRLSLVGRDEKTVSYLNLLPIDSLSAGQVLSAMRADPEHTGRLAMARQFLEIGEFERAMSAVALDTRSARRIESLQRAIEEGADEERLAALPDLEPAETDPESRLIAARACLALNRLDDALIFLNALDQDPIFGSEAFALTARVQLSRNDLTSLEKLAAHLIEMEQVDRKQLIAVSEHLLRWDQTDLAQLILQRLDSEPATRGGDVLIKLALVEALKGNRAAALEFCERAEAFLSNGEPQLVQVLLAVEDHEWRRMPALVAELRASDFKPGPEEDAILDLLSEQVAQGAAKAAEGLQANPRAAGWALVHAAGLTLTGAEPSVSKFYGARYLGELQSILQGEGEQLRDPREVLGHLLAMGRGDWAVWVKARLTALYPSGSNNLWQLYLRILADLRLGRYEHARTQLDFILRHYKNFGPAWDLSEQFALDEAGGDHYTDAMLELRKRRSKAMSSRNTTNDYQRALNRALTCREEGELSSAETQLRKAIAERKDAPNHIHELLAHILVENEDHAGAVAEYLLALADVQDTSDHRLVPFYIEAIIAASKARRSGLRPQQGINLLSKLKSRLPTDPAITLGLARMELLADTDNPGVALNRAINHMNKFRRSQDGTPLEQLRTGITREWVEFLLELDPQQAQTLITAELELQPGLFDLWLLRARTAFDAGHRDEALELYQDLVDMSGDPEAHLGLAKTLTATGASLEEIHRHLDLATASATSEKNLLRATHLRIKAELQSIDPPIAQLLTTLEELWVAQADDIDMFAVGQAYVHALLLSRTLEDLLVLSSLPSRLALLADNPYEHDLVRALSGFAQHVTERDLEMEQIENEKREDKPRRKGKKKDREK